MNNEYPKGRIHSTESFGAADGPGVRFVIFMQGSNMRRKYSHNHDPLKINGGEEMTADEILQKAVRYRSYWGADGGITVSGGEPLLQIEFLTDLMKKAKNLGIHTTIDTSGSPFNRNEPFFSEFNELMKYTDLVILDIKEINPARHKAITGFDNANILNMAEYLSEIRKPTWIRNVLVPKYSDFDEDILLTGEFIKKLSSVERAEVLPYHTLGKFKWEELGIKYELEEINPPEPERIELANKCLQSSVNHIKSLKVI